MIHRLSSTDRSFKTLRFRKGLNVLLAEKDQAAQVTDTRNGAGKTSVIELVQFLLGAEWERVADNAIRDDLFRLEFELGKQTVTVERSGRTPGRVTFVAQNDFSDWPITPERRNGVPSLRVDDWNAVLGHFAFRLPVEHHADRFRPKFRGLFSYFARRVREGAFNKPHEIHAQQRVWDQQVAVTYLLGLDWTIPRDMEKIRVKERFRRELRKALTEGEDAVTGREQILDSAALRTRLQLSENRAHALKDSLSRFRVVAEYHELEREASEIQGRTSVLSDQNTVDRQIVVDLEQALAAEAPPGSEHLQRIYQEAGLLLPAEALRRFDEVRAFHESVIRNRRTFLESEIRITRERIAAREVEQVRLDERRGQIVGILQTSGALDAFTQLQEEFARMQAEVEQLRLKYQDALNFESVGREVAMESARLESRMAVNQLEQADQIARAVTIFGDISKRLYTKPGQLIVSRSLHGAPVRIEIPRQDSEGVEKMQVFCFDLTMMELMHERDLGLGFLIHDSHLFDGVDARQISRALAVAEEKADELGFQYITMMNTDVAAEVSKERFDVLAAAMSTVLSDQERGGLFGKAFGNEPPSKRRRTKP
jgi:uncharacterized protein YydD (DUF2326 family)